MRTPQTPALSFPFTYRVYSDLGHEAFRIDLVATIEEDPDAPGEWYAASFQCGGLAIEEVTRAGEQQSDAFLFYLLSEYEEQVDNAWGRHLALAQMAGVPANA